MAVFTPNKTIVTRESSITVDAGLEPGQYRFRLVVEDEHGNRSLPDEIIITISRRTVPTIPGRITVPVGRG